MPVLVSWRSCDDSSNCEGNDLNGFIGLVGVLTLLLFVGGAFGLLSKSSFDLKWLGTTAGLVALNDFLLTRGYGLMPEILPPGDWNWQGKVLALLATLAIATLPAFGWRASGIRLDQAKGSLMSSLPIVFVYCAFFAVLALAFESEPSSSEEIAFQLTMPGLEEELFYRGILLLTLDRAFNGRVQFLGVKWGWGAVLSCGLFGLAHAFSFSDGQFAFDPITMALTAVPSFIAVWLRLRTGSLLLPVLLHNFGNSIMMLI
jgi:uncharacterized protein